MAAREEVVPENVLKQFQKLMNRKEKQIKQKRYSWKFEGKWLRAGHCHYSFPPNDESRIWETVERTTREGSTDAVDIIATNKETGMILLVAVYRPPVDKICLEFPSGLIDKGESSSEAGKRELREETGHDGIIETTSVPVYCDPWKSNENTVIIEMRTSTTDTGTLSLDSDEFLEPLYLPVTDLLKSLKTLKEKFDIEIESKLYTFALGLQIGKCHHS